MGVSLRSLGSQPQEKKEKKKEGLLGRLGGFVGVGNLADDLLSIPGGLLNLGSAAIRGDTKTLGQAAKGIGGSLLGTAATPFAMLGKANPVELIGDKIFGEDSTKDIFERIGERGLASSLFEDIGNIALGAGGAGAALRGGTAAGKVSAVSRAAKMARKAGMTDDMIAASKRFGRGSDTIRNKAMRRADAPAGPAARRLARAERRAAPVRGTVAPAAVEKAGAHIAKLDVAAHPYRSAAAGTRQITGAAERLNIASKALPGQDATKANEAALAAGDAAEAAGIPPRRSPAAEQISQQRAEGVRPGVLSAVEGLPEPVKGALAAGERFFQGREARKVEMQHSRITQAEAMKGTRRAQKASQPAIQGLMARAAAAGETVDAATADRMVGDAIQSRLKQTTVTEDLARAGGLDYETAATVGGGRIGEHLLPEQYMDPEMAALLDAAAAEWAKLPDQALARLEGARRGDEGLADATAEEVKISKADQKKLDAVEKAVNAATTKRDKAVIANVMETAKRALGLSNELDAAKKTISKAVNDESAARARVLELVDLPDNMDMYTLSTLSTSQIAQFLKARVTAGTEAERAALRQADVHLKKAIAAEEKMVSLREKWGLQEGEQLTTRPTSTFKGESKSLFGRRSSKLAVARKEMQELQKTIDSEFKLAEAAQENVKAIPETVAAMKVRARAVQKAVDDSKAAQRVIDKHMNVVDRLIESQSKLDEFLSKMEGGSDADLARALNAASKRAQRVVDRIETVGAAHVPPRWKPFFNGIDSLRRHAAEHNNAALAEALAEVPTRATEVFEWARRNGYDPKHVASMTPGQVEKLTKGRLNIAGRLDAPSGRRKTRTRAETMDRSVSALAAAWNDVVLEQQRGAFVDWLTTGDNPVARRADEFPTGDPPEGWVAWDPARPFTRHVADPQAERVARSVGGPPGPPYYIPKSVASKLEGMTQTLDHASFRAVRKVTQPWRYMALTLAPRWYVNNAVGNLIMSAKEGVNLADWAAAWSLKRIADGKQPRRIAKAMPGVEERLGAFAGQIDEVIEGAVGPSLFDDLIKAEDMAEGGKVRNLRNKVMQASERVQRANTNIDEMGRLAVYINSKGKGYSSEVALQRAHEALVDYADLGPLERGLVRSVIPFYSWQKGIMKITAKFPLDHPGRAAVLLAIGQLQQDLNEGLPEYYRRGLVDLPLIGQYNTASAIPFTDADSLLSPEGIAGSANPFVELIVRDALGAPDAGYADGYRVDRFGRAIPNVDVTSELFGDYGIVSGLPTQRLLGMGGGDAGDFGPYLGLKPVSGERVQDLQSRQARSGARAEGLGAQEQRAAVRAAGGEAPEPTKGSPKSRLKKLGIKIPEPNIPKPKLPDIGR